MNPARLLPHIAVLLAAIAPGWAEPATTVSLPQSRPKTPVRYAFGTLDPVQHPQVSHVFLLRNAGPTPLVLSELDTSCRCTTATVETPDGAPPTLAPGRQTTVHVTIIFESLLRGPLTKDVYVYIKGSDQPMAVLEMAGLLRSPQVVKKSSVKKSSVKVLDRRVGL